MKTQPTPPNKEQIYDAEICPLMAKIIEVCQKHKIAMLSDFAIPNAECNDLRCTSAILTEDTNPPENMLQAWKLVRPALKKPMVMITTTHEDGSKTMTAFVD